MRKACPLISLPSLRVMVISGLSALARISSSFCLMLLKNLMLNKGGVTDLRGKMVWVF